MRELIVHLVPAAGDAPRRVRVSYRPEAGGQVQERESDFSFSVSQSDRHLIQWYLEEYLLCPWGEFKNRAEKAEGTMERLGGELFDAIFGNRETLALYTHVADHLRETRIIIHASDSEGIAIPWELVRDPARHEYGSLMQLAHSFVRSQPDLMFEPTDRHPYDESFNILMVISRPTRDDGSTDPVPFQSVARPLLELFRSHRDRIKLDIVRPPTLERLSSIISEKPDYYHVFHFDGHGTFPAMASAPRFYSEIGDQGRLLFESGDGTPREVTGEELGSLLAGRGIPVVLLNACQSGMAHPESLYPSVGNQLLKAGSRGVVAMAWSVYVQTAVHFMAKLYEGLLGGSDLARAVANARESLRVNPERRSPIGEIALRDWIVPLLFEAAPVRLTVSAATVASTNIRLDPTLLEDYQTTAGAEVDCPREPDFGFVGRDSVVLELERAFQTETLVLLQGMAGVGKTEMAVGFSRWLAETGGLTGPIFFFRFEHYVAPDQLYDRIGQVFQSSIKSQLDVEWHVLDQSQRRSIAVQILRQLSCLVIWDNFEPVAGFPKGTQSDWDSGEQTELREFLLELRGGMTKVLVTSRRDEAWLGNVYRRVEMSGLTLVEAQELSVRVIRRAGLKAAEIQKLENYNDLLLYLRGNPLAIQVILPELREKTPDELLSALRSGDAVLGTDDRTLGRERSLAASLTYRVDALDPTIRKRLGVLKQFQGFVTAFVLERMCKGENLPPQIRGVDTEEWAKTLSVAADVGLLQRAGEWYYRVHPALPSFFSQLQTEAVGSQATELESAFVAAYSEYAPSLVHHFRQDAKMALDLLSAEEQNLNHAGRLAIASESWDELSGIVEGVWKLLTAHGRTVELNRFVGGIESKILDETGEPIPSTTQLWIAIMLRRIEDTYRTNDTARRAELERRFLDYCYRDDVEHGMRIDPQMTLLMLEHGQAHAQVESSDASLDMNERVGERHSGEVDLQFHEGTERYKKGELDEADEYYQKSLKSNRERGDSVSEVIALGQLGLLSLERSLISAAAQWYKECQKVVEDIGDSTALASTLHQLGRVAQLQSNFDDAERLYRQALELRVRHSDNHGEASAVHQLGRVAEQRGDVSEAERFFERAVLLYRKLDRPERLAMAEESQRRVRSDATE